jgi:hypothetical protein
MHTRERGAVNTMFFLIIFVLMLGAAFFGYSQYDQAKNLQVQVAAANAETAKIRLERTVRDHLLEDIRKVVGEAGSYKGREGWDYSSEIEEARRAGVADAAIPELANVTIPSRITTKVAEFARDLEIPASLTNGLTDMLGQVQNAFAAKKTAIADAKVAIAKLTSERTELERANATINTERTADASKSAQAVAELRQHIDSTFTERQRLIDAMRAENQQRRTDLSELTEKHKAEARELAKEIDLRNAKNAALAAAVKLHNPPEASDGEVLSCSPATNLGYINLGTKDMLPAGAVFTITDPRDSKHKAMAKVTAVEQGRAQVQIYDVKDKFDYPVAGDKISSPIYSPGVRRQVALIGRFGYPYTKDMVKTIFESLGNKVHDKVGPGVDLVILGDETLNEEGTEFVKVEDSEDYKLASKLGSEFAPVNKIRGFLKQ